MAKQDNLIEHPYYNPHLHLFGVIVCLLVAGLILVFPHQSALNLVLITAAANGVLALWGLWKIAKAERAWRKP